MEQDTNWPDAVEQSQEVSGSRHDRMVMLRRDALVMANARRLIKSKNITSNGRLYMELFGTGLQTARDRVRELGLDPDDNATSYNSMIESLAIEQMIIRLAPKNNYASPLQTTGFY